MFVAILQESTEEKRFSVSEKSAVEMPLRYSQGKNSSIFLARFK